MDRASPSTTLAVVVPCFEEVERLRVDDLQHLAATEGIWLVLVDDGSSDGTLELLRSVAANSPSVSVVALSDNVGKGEAVRRGLLHARTIDTEWVGYLDADLATPPGELLRLLSIGAGHPDLQVVIGARVALLGRWVHRSLFRHYTGRIFATLASIVLDLAVYDTQCGAKVIRTGDELDRAISITFRSRWAFDVELLGRLRAGGLADDSLWEEPLLAWSDVAASRRTLRASIRSTAELLTIRRDLRRWSRGDGSHYRRRREASPEPTSTR
jgi:dolichyl-phosphate beta-glucosyltransferase